MGFGMYTKLPSYPFRAGNYYNIMLIEGFELVTFSMKMHIYLSLDQMSLYVLNVKNY